ncbi:MAG: hypothetical protein FWH21_04120, partial [Kiritimatiellaeota bacterium]|nr:hypothetical protein [Kiritimatiellota bacterium]
MRMGFARLACIVFTSVVCVGAWPVPGNGSFFPQQPQMPREMALVLERDLAQGLGILFPDPDQPVVCHKGILPLPPPGSTNFLPGFISGLAGVSEYGVTVYPVTLRVDDVTGGTVFLNAADVPFWSEAPGGAYAPDWIFSLHCAGLDPDAPATLRLAALLAPSHVAARWTFVARGDLPAHRAGRLAALAAPAGTRGGPGGPPLKIAGVAAGADAFRLAAAWDSRVFFPDRSLDVFFSETLSPPAWSLLKTEGVAPHAGGGEITVTAEEILGLTRGGGTAHGPGCEPEIAVAPSPLDPSRAYTNTVCACAPQRGGGTSRGTGFFRLSVAGASPPGYIDSDGDGLPDSYEDYYGLDTFSPDSHLVPRLIVTHSPSAPNEFATIRAALAASAPYSVIEVRDGEYAMGEWPAVVFPPHPVLLMSEDWGRSRRAVIRDFGRHGLSWLFEIPGGADNRTIVRGLHVRMEPNPASAGRIAFWVGAGDPTDLLQPGASPVFENVTVEMADHQARAFYVMHAAPEPVVFVNCVIAQRLGLTGDHARGVQAVDAPPLVFEHCTFMADPRTEHSVGVQLDHYYAAYAVAALPPETRVDFVNCLWDAGFAAAPGVVRAPFLKNEPFPFWAVYPVSMRSCATPSAMADYGALCPLAYPGNYDVASATDLFAAPVSLALGGHLRAPLPHYGAPPLLAPFDFDGQPRNPIAPDIGADEFIPLPPGDLDNDGLDNWDEIILHGTNPYLADSDGDGIGDGAEVAAGAAPTDYWDWAAAVTVTLTNTFSSTLTNLVYIGPSPDIAGLAPAAAIAGGGTAQVQGHATNGAVWVTAVCDHNANGIPDPATEPFYQKKITQAGPFVADFTVGDFDGDGVEDDAELLHGTSPFDPAEFCLTLTA